MKPQPGFLPPRVGRSARAVILLLAALFAGGTAALAQSPAEHEANSYASPTPAPAGLWETRSRWSFGAQLAYAQENAIPRNISHVNLLIAQPNVGFRVRTFHSPRSPASRFSILSEGIFGNAVHPGGSLLGHALLFRFDGQPRHPVIPYLQFGAGMLRTTLDTKAPEISGHLQFTPQAGLGGQYFFNAQRAFVLEYRYMHMSNAGIQQPNHGFNASMVSIGFRWLMRPIQPAVPPAHRPRNLFQFLFGAD